MGMQMRLPGNYVTGSAVARLNHEDRKYAAHIGLYFSTVDSLNHDYQATGNGIPYRCEVAGCYRWKRKRTSGDWYAFIVFRANHYSTDDFENGPSKEQKHTIDIKISMDKLKY